MKKYFKKIVILSFLTAFLVLPFTVFASPAYDLLKKVGSEGTDAPFTDINNTNSLSGIIAALVKVFLGLLGIIFLVLIIYAGYSWMTAQGDEEKVTKAKDTLTRAIIGLVIIIAAYSITYFVFSSLPGGEGAGNGADVNIQ